MYALEKRPETGLLAGLWQFPNVTGRLQTEQSLETVEKMGLRPRELTKIIERKHIFTHIIWKMQGIYLEVAEPSGNFRWMTAAEIRETAALPTAFRQFFEEADYV